jgi:hypothetical protein
MSYHSFFGLASLFADNSAQCGTEPNMSITIVIVVTERDSASSYLDDKDWSLVLGNEQRC